MGGEWVATTTCAAAIADETDTPWMVVCVLAVWLPCVTLPASEEVTAVCVLTSKVVVWLWVD